MIDTHDLNYRKLMPRWEAEKIVLAARTFAGVENYRYLLAMGAAESHFRAGAVGDDGFSQGIYQVQWKYHKHVRWEMLSQDITTNTRCAVEHLKWAGWDAQAYNAGINGKKRGRGKWHKIKVNRAYRKILDYEAKWALKH